MCFGKICRENKEIKYTRPNQYSNLLRPCFLFPFSLTIFFMVCLLSVVPLADILGPQGRSSLQANRKKTPADGICWSAGHGQYLDSCFCCPWPSSLCWESPGETRNRNAIFWRFTNDLERPSMDSRKNPNTPKAVHASLSGPEGRPTPR